MSIFWDLLAETSWDFLILLPHARAQISMLGRAAKRLLLDMRTLFADSGTHCISPHCLVAPLHPEDPTMQLSKVPSWSMGSLLPICMDTGGMSFF